MTYLPESIEQYRIEINNHWCKMSSFLIICRTRTKLLGTNATSGSDISVFIWASVFGSGDWFQMSQTKLVCAFFFLFKVFPPESETGGFWKLFMYMCHCGRTSSSIERKWTNQPSNRTNVPQPAYQHFNLFALHFMHGFINHTEHKWILFDVLLWESGRFNQAHGTCC